MQQKPSEPARQPTDAELEDLFSDLLETEKRDAAPKKRVHKTPFERKMQKVAEKRERADRRAHDKIWKEFEKDAPTAALDMELDTAVRAHSERKAPPMPQFTAEEMRAEAAATENGNGKIEWVSDGRKSKFHVNMNAEETTVASTQAEQPLDPPPAKVPRTTQENQQISAPLFMAKARGRRPQHADGPAVAVQTPASEFDAPVEPAPGIDPVSGKLAVQAPLVQRPLAEVGISGEAPQQVTTNAQRRGTPAEEAAIAAAVACLPPVPKGGHREPARRLPATTEPAAAAAYNCAPRASLASARSEVLVAAGRDENDPDPDAVAIERERERAAGNAASASDAAGPVADVELALEQSVERLRTMMSKATVQGTGGGASGKSAILSELQKFVKISEEREGVRASVERQAWDIWPESLKSVVETFGLQSGRANPTVVSVQYDVKHPDLATYTRAFEEHELLREIDTRNLDNGEPERACCKGEKCIMYAKYGYRMRECVSPHENEHRRHTRKWLHTQPRMCLPCRRWMTAAGYYSQRVAATPCDPDLCYQSHGNLINIKGEYNADNCIVPSGVYLGIWEPIVLHTDEMLVPDGVPRGPGEPRFLRQRYPPCDGPRNF